MALEPWSSLIARRQLRRIGDSEPAQRALLQTIVKACHDSAVGKALSLRSDMTFEDFLRIAPRDYAFYDPFVQRVLHGESRVFGHDPIIACGETSGSMGQPKLIPHTASSLACFAKATRIMLLFQLRNSPNYLPRFTRWLCITASSNVRYHNSIAIGFISGLIYQQARATRLLPVFPSASIAALESWDERVKRVAAEALPQRIGTLLGVPAYLERFLAEASLQAGTKRLAEIWPWLDEVYYSGTSMDAHRAVLEAYLDRPLHFRSIYSATEGVFAVELERDGGGWMWLLPDMAVCTFRDVDNPAGPLLAMWQLEPGRRYELFVTTRAGLCQYRIGDVLETDATDRNQIRVRVAGRTGDEINIATEKLSSKQAQATFAELSRELGVSVPRFLVVPDPASPRRHVWAVEQPVPVEPHDVARRVDRILARINPSYKALRENDAVLQGPRVVMLQSGAFDEYVQGGLAKRGQFKFRHVFATVDQLRGHADLAFVAPQLEGSSRDDSH